MRGYFFFSNSNLILPASLKLEEKRMMGRGSCPRPGSPLRANEATHSLDLGFFDPVE